MKKTAVTMAMFFAAFAIQGCFQEPAVTGPERTAVNTAALTSCNVGFNSTQTAGKAYRIGASSTMTWVVGDPSDKLFKWKGWPANDWMDYGGQAVHVAASDTRPWAVNNSGTLYYLRTGASWESVAGLPNGMKTNWVAVNGAEAVYVLGYPTPIGLSAGYVFKRNSATGAWTKLTNDVYFYLGVDSQERLYAIDFNYQLGRLLPSVPPGNIMTFQPIGVQAFSLAVSPQGTVFYGKLNPGTSGIENPLWRYDPATGCHGRVFENDQPAVGYRIAAQSDNHIWTVKTSDGTIHELTR